MRRRISSVPTRLPGSEFKNQTVRSIDPNTALVLHTKSYTGTRGEYQSRIRDLYDNSIVTYKTAASQTVYIVLDTIHLAIRWEKKKVAGELQLHSDQGFQYTSQAYSKLTLAYRITLFSPMFNQISNILPICRNIITDCDFITHASCTPHSLDLPASYYMILGGTSVALMIVSAIAMRTFSFNFTGGYLPTWSMKQTVQRSVAKADNPPHGVFHAEGL